MRSLQKEVNPVVLVPTKYDEQYIQQAEKCAQADSLGVVFLGESPYPSGATGIPFCKKNWGETRKNSGKYICDLLNLFVSQESWNKKPPLCYFRHLLCHGMLFLNMWQYANDFGCTEAECVLKQTSCTNIPLLKKAETVVVCGFKTWYALTNSTAYEDLWRDCDCKAAFIHAIHPAARGKHYKKKIEEWGQGGSLFKHVQRYFKKDIVCRKY